MPANVAKVADAVLNMNEGKVFSKMFGAPAAKALITEFVSNCPQTKMLLANKSDKEVANAAAIYLDLDGKNAITAEKSLQKMGAMLFAGKLASTVAAKHKIAPAKFKSKDDDADLTKAAKWIAFSSNSDKANFDKAVAGYEKILSAAVKMTAPNKWDHIKAFHKAVLNIKEDKGFRNVVAGNMITSSPTGSALLKTAVTTIETKTPGQGACKWEDLAVYLMSSVIRSHGFIDGNGRAARALFALAMLKGNVPFWAMDEEGSRAITGLDGKM